jgi:hypothetical protein
MPVALSRSAGEGTNIRSTRTCRLAHGVGERHATFASSECRGGGTTSDLRSAGQSSGTAIPFDEPHAKRGCTSSGRRTDNIQQAARGFWGCRLMGIQCHRHGLERRRSRQQIRSTMSNIKAQATGRGRFPDMGNNAIVSRNLILNRPRSHNHHRLAMKFVGAGFKPALSTPDRAAARYTPGWQQHALQLGRWAGLKPAPTGITGLRWDYGDSALIDQAARD